MDRVYSTSEGRCQAAEILASLRMSPRFWHPFWVLGHRDMVFRWSFKAKGERPPATLWQPFGLTSRGLSFSGLPRRGQAVGVGAFLKGDFGAAFKVPHDVGGDKDDQFLLRLGVEGAGEELAQEGEVA